MEGRPWLKPGDRVRVEIDGLGAIENEVVQEQLPIDRAVAA
jgi:2-keto-4-pentenoate hydratase/2-oxohepta-3-ene-1,7-dioic acid hydratase in catechol pathway